MKKFIKPHILFSFTGLLILACGLLFFRSRLDIPVHDTYFVINQVYLATALCILFLVFALFYFLFKRAGKPLNIAAGILHYLFTILPFVGIPLLLQSQSRYTTGNFSAEMDKAANTNAIIAGIFLLFITGQLLFLINCIVTIIRKRKQL